ncbi:MAG: hypothetical protein HC938_13840 [Nitrospira sp.]|nr:hypothetical protein [Nitrospira sp.]
MKPYVVSEIRDADGHLLKRVAPQVKRRVISPETARSVTRILEGVVTRGTGTRAAIPGFRVAGKTGTAQQIDPKTHRYSSSRFVTSFVGYVPADKPRLAMIVIIDGPKDKRASGGSLAAPVFSSIGEQVLSYLGVSSEQPITVAMATPNL